jgi:hypothetical protein
MDVDNIPSGPMKDFQKWMTEAEEAVVPMRNESACPGLEAFIPPALEMSAERVAKVRVRDTRRLAPGEKGACG